MARSNRWKNSFSCQLAGYNLPQFVALSRCLFVAEISLLWQIVYVSILMSLLSIQCIAVQSPLVLTRMSHHLSFTVLHPKSFGMPSMFSPTVPKQLVFFFVSSLASSRKEKKLPMYSLWPCPSAFSPVLSLWCLLLYHVLSALLQVDFRVIWVTIGVSKFVNFDVRTLVLLGNI